MDPKYIFGIPGVPMFFFMNAKKMLKKLFRTLRLWLMREFSKKEFHFQRIDTARKRENPTRK